MENAGQESHEDETMTPEQLQRLELLRQERQAEQRRYAHHHVFIL